MPALIDVCIVVAAHRADHPHHEPARQLLDETFSDGFAYCAHTRNGFVRLVTHPRLFPQPTSTRLALAAWQAWIERPTARAVHDSEHAHTIFCQLCQDNAASGNRIYDWYLAALAISNHLPLWSTDDDFAGIPNLPFHQLEITR